MRHVDALQWKVSRSIPFRGSQYSNLAIVIQKVDEQSTMLVYLAIWELAVFDE